MTSGWPRRSHRQTWMTTGREEDRCRAALLAALALSALIGIGLRAGSGKVSAADTTPPQSMGPLFSGDETELRAPAVGALQTAARKAMPGGRCPQEVHFKVLVHQRPGGFDASLGDTRARQINHVVTSLPVPSGIPQDLVDSTSQVVTSGTDDVQVSYSDTPKDAEPPKVTLTTSPDPSACIVGGQKLTVSITASEAGINSWQTGIQSIELIANGVRQGSQSYPNAQCDPASWTRTWTTSYAVPPAATLVSLQGKASDFNGNSALSEAVNLLPCVLMGSLDWSSDQHVPAGTQHFAGHADIALGLDTTGKFAGRADGTQTQTLELSSCPSTTVTPGRVSARLSGSRSGDSLALAASDVTYTPPDVTPCPNSGKPATAGAIFTWPSTATALSGLARAPDGGYRYEGDVPVPMPMYSFTVHYRMILKPATPGAPVG
jgi:hypothetical protein